MVTERRPGQDPRLRPREARAAAPAARQPEQTTDRAPETERRHRDGDRRVHVARAGDGQAGRTSARTSSRWARSSTRWRRAGGPFSGRRRAKSSPRSSGRSRSRSRRSARTGPRAALDRRAVPREGAARSAIASTEDLARDLAGARDRGRLRGPLAFSATSAGARGRACARPSSKSRPWFSRPRPSSWRCAPGRRRSAAPGRRPIARGPAAQASSAATRPTRRWAWESPTRIIRGLSGAGAIPVRPALGGAPLREVGCGRPDGGQRAQDRRGARGLGAEIGRQAPRERQPSAEVDDGRSLWAESFDVPDSEVFEVQDAVSDAVVSRSPHPPRARAARSHEEALHAEPRGVPGVRAREKRRRQGGAGLGRGLPRRDRFATTNGAVCAGPRLCAGARAAGQRVSVARPVLRTGHGIPRERQGPSLAQAERLDPQLAETHQGSAINSRGATTRTSTSPRRCVELRAAQKLDPLVRPRATRSILYAHRRPRRSPSTRGGRGRRRSIRPRRDGAEDGGSRGSCSSALRTKPIALADKLGDFGARESRLPMSLMSNGTLRRGAGRDGGSPEGGPGPATRPSRCASSWRCCRKSEPSTKRRSRGRSRPGRRGATITTRRTPSPASDRPRATRKEPLDMLRRTVATGMPDRPLFHADPLLASDPILGGIRRFRRGARTDLAEVRAGKRRLIR